MYKSPIEIVIGQMQTEQENNIFRAVQSVGINVDKEELIRALQYDREQYNKGYKDGLEEGMRVFAERLKSADYYTETGVYCLDDNDIDNLVKEMDREKRNSP